MALIASLIDRFRHQPPLPQNLRNNLYGKTSLWWLQGHDRHTANQGDEPSARSAATDGQTSARSDESEDPRTFHVHSAPRESEDAIDEYAVDARTSSEPDWYETAEQLLSSISSSGSSSSLHSPPLAALSSEWNPSHSSPMDLHPSFDDDALPRPLPQGSRRREVPYDLDLDESMITHQQRGLAGLNEPVATHQQRDLGDLNSDEVDGALGLDELSARLNTFLSSASSSSSSSSSSSAGHTSVSLPSSMSTTPVPSPFRHPAAARVSTDGLSARTTPTSDNTGAPVISPHLQPASQPEVLETLPQRALGSVGFLPSTRNLQPVRGQEDTSVDGDKASDLSTTASTDNARTMPLDRPALFAPSPEPHASSSLPAVSSDRSPAGVALKPTLPSVPDAADTPTGPATHVRVEPVVNTPLVSTVTEAHTHDTPHHTAAAAAATGDSAVSTGACSVQSAGIKPHTTFVKRPVRAPLPPRHPKSPTAVRGALDGPTDPFPSSPLALQQHTASDTAAAAEPLSPPHFPSSRAARSRSPSPNGRRSTSLSPPSPLELSPASGAAPAESAAWPGQEARDEHTLSASPLTDTTLSTPVPAMSPAQQPSLLRRSQPATPSPPSSPSSSSSPSFASSSSNRALRRRPFTPHQSPSQPQPQPLPQQPKPQLQSSQTSQPQQSPPISTKPQGERVDIAVQTGDEEAHRFQRILKQALHHTCTYFSTDAIARREYLHMSLIEQRLAWHLRDLAFPARLIACTAVELAPVVAEHLAGGSVGHLVGHNDADDDDDDSDDTHRRDAFHLDRFATGALTLSHASRLSSAPSATPRVLPSPEQLRKQMASEDRHRLSRRTLAFGINADTWRAPEDTSGDATSHFESPSPSRLLRRDLSYEFERDAASLLHDPSATPHHLYNFTSGSFSSPSPSHVLTSPSPSRPQRDPNGSQSSLVLSPRARAAPAEAAVAPSSVPAVPASTLASLEQSLQLTALMSLAVLHQLTQGRDASQTLAPSSSSSSSSLSSSSPSPSPSPAPVSVFPPLSASQLLQLPHSALRVHLTFDLQGVPGSHTAPFAPHAQSQQLTRAAADLNVPSAAASMTPPPASAPRTSTVELMRLSNADLLRHLCAEFNSPLPLLDNTP